MTIPRAIFFGLSLMAVSIFYGTQSNPAVAQGGFVYTLSQPVPFNDSPISTIWILNHGTGSVRLCMGAPTKDNPPTCGPWAR